MTSFTVTLFNIIETSLTMWAKPLSFAKQKSFRQFIIRHSEDMIEPAESFAK